MGYKRWFDLAIIVLAHVILAPLFCALWIGIPLLIFLIDGRPIFFTQERVGKNGKIFKAYKFRTMVKNAREVGPSYTTENDPRVLPVIGKMLRSTGLDELPQLINILKGELSFVGPRPLPVEDHERCVLMIPSFKEREKLLPGLTGLAQLYADRLSWESWVIYDKIYQEKMSPLLDLEILILSVLVTLTGRWDHRGARVPLPGFNLVKRAIEEAVQFSK
jgi:lipopolysaccharide/colanic/teichoic acid biosynthesis glycosyltransferase